MRFLFTLSVLFFSTFAFAKSECTMENLKDIVNPDTEASALLKIEQMDKVIFSFHEKNEAPIHKKELEREIEFFKKNASPQLAKRIITTLEEDFPNLKAVMKTTFNYDVVRFIRNKAKAIEQIKAIQKKYNVSATDCQAGSLSELGLNLELRQIDPIACEDIIANLKSEQGEASQAYLKSYEKEDHAYRYPPKINLEGLLYEIEDETGQFSKKELDKITNPIIRSDKLDKQKLKVIDDLIAKGPYKVRVRIGKSKYSSVKVNQKRREMIYKVVPGGNRICSPLYSIPDLIIDNKKQDKIMEECWVR